MTVCGDARFRCADDDAEFIRVAAVLEPLFHFRSGVHSPQRLFNGILRSQSAVDLYAVPNGPALYLDRIGIVVPVNVQVVSQHVQRRFVQFVDTGVNDVLSDFRRGRLQLCRNGLCKRHHVGVVFQRRRKRIREVCRIEVFVIHVPHLRSRRKPCRFVQRRCLPQS